MPTAGVEHSRSTPVVGVRVPIVRAWAAPAAATLIVIAVLAWAPDALDRWTLPKLLVLAVAALVALAAPSRGRIPLSVISLGMLAATLIVASSLLAADPVSAALGRWPRFDGLIAVTGVALAAWLGARLLGPGSTASTASPASLVRGVAVTTAIGAGVLALVTAAEYVGLRPIASNLERPGALLGSASDQGAVAAVALTVLLARLSLPAADLPRARGAEALLLVSGTVAALSTVVASGSRAGLLGASAALIVVALLTLTRRRSPDGLPLARRKSLVMIGGTLVALVSAVFAVPSTAQRLLDGSGLAAESAADRLLIWGETLSVLALHPVLGPSPGGFIDAVAAQHSPTWFAAVGQQTVLDSPHNVGLQLAIGGGPVLLLAGLALLALTARAVVRSRLGPRAPIAIIAGGGLVALLVPLAVQPTSAATLLLLGLWAGAALAAAPSATSSPRAIAAGALLAGAIAAFAIMLTAELHLGRAAHLATAGSDVAAVDEALRNAQAARPFDPDIVIIGAELLVARVDAGDLGAKAAAHEWVDRAALAAPNSLAAGRAAVTLALAEGDLPLARARVDALIERVPQHPWPRHRSGGIALFEGDLERAERELLLAAERDPAWADPWLTLAALYDLTGQSAQAQQARAEAQARGAGG
jgi:O-antigen ligase